MESLVSPPLQLQDQPDTLWLRWSLADAGAFWAARYASGDPAVVAFWSELDSFVLKRERHYLVPADAALPGPEDTTAYRCQPVAWRETAQLYLKGDITEAERAAFAALLERAATELPGVDTASLAANFVPDYGAGHYTWDLVYPDRATAEAARASSFWREQLLPALDRHCRARAALGLETLGAGARAPALASGVKRTALFRLLPGVSAELQSRFARDTLEMAAQIPAILNWRLSRAVPLAWDAPDCAPWSFVWEQEYADARRTDRGLHGASAPLGAHRPLVRSGVGHADHRHRAVPRVCTAGAEPHRAVVGLWAPCGSPFMATAALVFATASRKAPVGMNADPH